MIRTLALLFLSACTALGGDDGKDPEGGDTAGGDDTGDDGGAAGPCPAYSGYAAVGNAWTYGYTSDYEAEAGYAYEVDMEVVGFDVAGADATVTLAFDAALTYDAGGSQTTSSTYVYRCTAEGLFADTMSSEWVSTFGGNSTEGWVEAVYEDDGPQLPHGIDVGSTWTVATTVTSTSSTSSEPSSAQWSYTAVATGRESVEVPAGAFDALLVEYDYDTSSTVVSALDRGVGLVLSGDDYQLEAYSR